MGLPVTALVGRKARCAYCKRERDSSLDLPFFEFRGEGSEKAQRVCKHCMYFKDSHDPLVTRTYVLGNRKTVVEKGICPGFEEHGPFEFDRYYCGCCG